MASQARLRKSTCKSILPYKLHPKPALLLLPVAKGRLAQG